MGFHVDAGLGEGEVARQMSNDADLTLETLSALAEIFDGDAEAFAEDLALEFSGSASQRRIAPFLRTLADALDAAGEEAR